MRMILNTILRSLVGLLLVATVITSGALASGQRLVHNAAGTFGRDGNPKGTHDVVYKLSGSRNVCIRITGTTPIHDWSMCAIGLSGEARMLVTEDDGLEEVRSLDFALPVCNLRGDVRAMDNDAHAALKCDRYKEITFKLIAAKVEPKGAGTYSVSAMGKLTIAGITRTVTLRMRSRMQPDGTITFAGEEQLRMSDYNVERPSLLFGAIKADDVMTLSYSLAFTE